MVRKSAAWSGIPEEFPKRKFPAALRKMILPGQAGCNPAGYIRQNFRRHGLRQYGL